MNIKIKIRKKVLLLPFRLLLHPKSQAGSVALVVALAMIVLLTMLAFVIDTGYLYGKKNKYQNGVEAAAMAGAVSLCDGDPAGVARQVAIDNGLPAGSITVKVGFYDEKNLYDNFQVYKDFVAEGEAVYPEDEFNNAVMVKLNVTEETLMGGFVGKDEVTVKAAAVAYLVRYGMLALVEEEDGIETSKVYKYWQDGYPQFKNMGFMHSNSNIDFTKGKADVTLTGDTILTASGYVNFSEGIEGAARVSIPPVDWNEFEAKANNSGQVITEDDFPDSGCLPDDNGNQLCKDGNLFYFRLNRDIEDHKGRTYYFKGLGGNLIVRGKATAGTTYAYNFTIAAECNISFLGGSVLQLGGEGEKTVYIYSNGDIGQPHFNTATRFDGVVLRAEKNLYLKFNETGPGHTQEFTYRARGIAGGKIEFGGGRYPFNKAAIVWYGLFGPPCPPAVVKLGRLTATAQ